MIEKGCLNKMEKLSSITSVVRIIINILNVPTKILRFSI